MRQFVTKQSAFLTRAAQNESITCDNHLLAAEDFAARIHSLSQEMIERIKGNEIDRAQFIAGQIFQISRLAEQRLLIAVERKHAALTIAESAIREMPKKK